MKSRQTKSLIPQLKRLNKGPTQRQRRIAEVIRHALAEIFAQRNLRDPFFADIRLTITEVNVGGDLKTATAYLFFPQSVKPIEVLIKLKQAKNEIRAQLSAHLALKFIPDLVFKHDTSLEYGEKIDEILRRVATLPQK